MKQNLKHVLMFFIVLIILFWMMPNTKINVISNFFEKVVVLTVTLLVIAVKKDKMINRGNHD